MDPTVAVAALVEWNRLSMLSGIIERNVGVQCCSCLDSTDTPVLVDEAAKVFYLEVPSGFHWIIEGCLLHRCGGVAKLFSYHGFLKGYQCKLVTGNPLS